MDKLYVKKYWVGLMDGDGSMQVNHWKKKSLQYRLVIKLKYTEANEKMLNTIAKNIGGTVRKKADNTVWVEDHRGRIKEILTIFNEFPPLTTRLRCQLAHIYECIEHGSVTTYLENRGSKYERLGEGLNKKSRLTELKYWPEWLSGFTEAEGCFSTRAGGTRSYSISQKNDKHLLEAIKEYFKANNVVRCMNKEKNVYILEIYSLAKLEVIKEHFIKYPLLGEKHESYLKFYK